MMTKIYENDNHENQQIFHDIEQSKKYSNYSKELNQTFGDKSYAKFYKDLIEHKKARCLNFMSMFQKPKNLTGLKVYDEPFNITEFKSALKAMKIKNDKLLYRIKNPYITRHKYKSEKKTRDDKEKEEEKKEEKDTKNTKRSKKEDKSDKITKIENIKNVREFNRKLNGKLYLPEVPDVGRYRPTYTVLDKHTYQVAFSQKTFDDFNKKDVKFNPRNIFNDHSKIDYSYNLYGKPFTLEMKKKFKKSKIKPIFIEAINNMSKTYNKLEQYPNQNEINNNLSNHFNTSSLFNSINLRSSISSNLNQNISPNIEINNSAMKEKSKFLSDSPILIRTNGDIHSRCPKHINNLNLNEYFLNTNSSLSFNESLNNSDSFNNSNSNINFSPKNNHCLKFETYSNRKPITRKFNYINESFINTEAYDSIFPQNKNICIDFGKLSTAKEKQKSFFEIEANKNHNPPLGTYHPKFGHAFKKIIDVYIDKKCPPKNNKTKLKEIVLRYDVPSKYLLFDVLNKK